jgi:hypothetical protein
MVTLGYPSTATTQYWDSQVLDSGFYDQVSRILQCGVVHPWYFGMVAYDRFMLGLET